MVREHFYSNGRVFDEDLGMYWHRFEQVEREEDDSWRDEAQCVGQDPDLFFHGKYVGGSKEKAAAQARVDAWPNGVFPLCEGCPVMKQCGDFSMRNMIWVGIWGGQDMMLTPPKVKAQVAEEVYGDVDK